MLLYQSESGTGSCDKIYSREIEESGEAKMVQRQTDLVAFLGVLTFRPTYLRWWKSRQPVSICRFDLVYLLSSILFCHIEIHGRK